MSASPDVSVIVPSRNRPVLLRRCLRALAEQETERLVEVIVVDDGSVEPVDRDLAEDLEDARILQVAGVGPAAARNAGWRSARSDVVLFTDDDTVPSVSWVESMCQVLEGQPDLVGVEGPVLTAPFDPLYEHSVSVTEAGSGLTCNVGYRRPALKLSGGFCEEFPYPHCEDIDLAHRMRRLGSVGFAGAAAEVCHDPRPQSAAALIRKGRWARSEILLHARHPGDYPGRTGVWLRLFPIYSWARYWAALAWRQRRLLLSDPKRLGRLIVVGTGNVVTTALFALTWRPPKRPSDHRGDDL